MFYFEFLEVIYVLFTLEQHTFSLIKIYVILMSQFRLNEEMRGLESLAMQLYPFLKNLGWFSGTTACEHCFILFSY